MILVRERGRQNKAWGEGASRNPSEVEFMKPAKWVTAIKTVAHFAGFIGFRQCSQGSALLRFTLGFMLSPTLWAKSRAIRFTQNLSPLI